MEAAESSLFPGYRLDRYELLCPIASGGMASVWLARLRGKRGFEKLFAIKTIKTELISDPNYTQMFLDEARIASRIVHPNIAQILELGEENDILFLVMEWVDGDSLAKVHRLLLKQDKPFPVRFALHIVADICAGLHAAHQLKDATTGELLGVVHRDVSPQNALLSAEGTAKVIDFGLVKAKGRTSAETEKGIVKGKIRYMAPEQVGRGSVQIDHRADVWACGMCLVELVTGKQPWDPMDDLDVVKSLMQADVAPPIPENVPPQVTKILEKALVRDREKRFASCAAMKREIDKAIAELGEAVDAEDIANFVKENLPDLAAKRQRTIARAIESADQRPADGKKLSSIPVSAPSSVKSIESEIGFAATEVSARAPMSANYEDEAVPLTRRTAQTEEASDAEHIVSNVGATSTGGTSLRDQLQDKKKSGGIGFWVAAAVVVAAATFILFPRGGSKPTATDPSAAPPPSAPPSVAEVPPPPSASVAALDLDLPVSPTAGSGATPAAATPDAGKKLTWPTGAPGSAKTAEVDAGAEKPKFNPAWSILTHPPEGVLSAEPAPAPAPKPE
jgi:serine/threonine-protein kinase